MRVVSIRNKLTAVEFCFFSISWLNELLHHRAAQQVRFLWDKWRPWWRNNDGKDIDDEDHTYKNNRQEEGVENDHLNSENWEML